MNIKNLKRQSMSIDYKHVTYSSIPFLGPLYSIGLNVALVKEQDRLISESNIPAAIFKGELPVPNWFTPEQKSKFIDYCKSSEMIKSSIFIGSIINAIISLSLGLFVPRKAYVPVKVAFLLQAACHSLYALKSQKPAWSYDSEKKSFSLTV